MWYNVKKVQISFQLLVFPFSTLLQPQEEIKAFETRAKKPLVKSIPGMPPPAPAPSSVHSKEKGSSKKISSPRPTSSSSSSSIPNPTKKPSNDLKSAKLPIEEPAPDISELHIKESRNSDNNESSSVCNHIKLADASEQSGIEKEKKLKSLRKKLRDIEELAKKDPKTLSDEQIQKINRKDEIMDQINLISAS